MPFVLVAASSYFSHQGTAVPFVLVAASSRKGTAPSFPFSYHISFFLPHFRLFEVVSLHICVLRYKYCKILVSLLNLMKLRGITGSRYGKRCQWCNNHIDIDLGDLGQTFSNQVFQEVVEEEERVYEKKKRKTIEIANIPPPVKPKAKVHVVDTPRPVSAKKKKKKPEPGVVRDLRARRACLYAVWVKHMHLVPLTEEPEPGRQRHCFFFLTLE